MPTREWPAVSNFPTFTSGGKLIFMGQGRALRVFHIIRKEYIEEIHMILMALP